MKTYDTLDDFLFSLNWTDNMRHKLRVVADRDDLHCLVAYDNAGRLAASAYTAEPDEWPSTVWAVWRKPSRADELKSRTQKAVDLVLKGQLTPHAAAKAQGLNASAVYRALQRAQNRTLCPCCGQVVREGFRVDKKVLKAP